MGIIKRKKHWITLATILGISGMNAVGYGTAYTTPQMVYGEMTLESTDTAVINSSTSANAFSIVGAGNVLNVNGTTIQGGTNIVSVLAIYNGGKANLASGSEVISSNTADPAIKMDGAGSELTISGSKINGVFMGIMANNNTKVTINSSLSNPTVITTANSSVYANQISANSSLTATGLIINDNNSQQGGYALSINKSQAVMDQCEINATGAGLIANNSTVSFTNGKITNTQKGGMGIYSFGGSTVTVGNTEINILGKGSRGAAVRNASMDITDSTIKVSGESGYGLTIEGTGSGSGTMTVKGTTVDASAGSGTIGIYLSSTATTQLTLDDSKVTATSTGIYNPTGSALVELKNGSEIYSNDILASVGTNGDLQINAADNSRLTGSFNVAGSGVGNLLLDDSAWTGFGSNVTKVELQNNSSWQMTADSTIKNLNFNGAGAGMVSYGTDLSSGSYGTLTVENLSGNGAFTMRTDLVGDGAGNNAGDFLDVTGTSAGSHKVTVPNNGAVNATGNETLTIIRTADGAAEFSNTNVIELGGYEYNLRDVAGSNKKEWELFGVKTVTPVPSGGGGGGGSSQPGSAAVNLFGGSYLLNYAETQTLMKRMGDLRDGKENGNVWGRVYGGKFHSDTDHFLKDFSMDYSGVQVGADKKFVREDGKGVVYLGGFFGYSKGNIDYGYGSGNVDSKSIGAYWTHMHHNGFYADAVFKYGWMKNDFDVRDSQGARVTGDDITTRGFTGSLEVGRRYHFDQKEKSGWYVEPQAQVLVSHQNGDHFMASNGLNVEVDAYRSVLGRVGANIGYEVKGGKNPINVYGKVSVVKEFDGDVDYSFNGSPEATSYKDTWLVYGVGATVKMGTRHNLYLDVERATGGQFTQSWAVNGGYRYAW